MTSLLNLRHGESAMRSSRMEVIPLIPPEKPTTALAVRHGRRVISLFAHTQRE
jgi:hypothetical protein